MYIELLQSLYWALPALLLSYHFVSRALEQQALGQGGNIPLISALPPLSPRFLHNIVFATRARSLLEKGYRKVRARLIINTMLRFFDWHKVALSIGLALFDLFGIKVISSSFRCPYSKSWQISHPPLLAPMAQSNMIFLDHIPVSTSWWKAGFII